MFSLTASLDLGTSSKRVCGFPQREVSGEQSIRPSRHPRDCPEAAQIYPKGRQDGESVDPPQGRAPGVHHQARGRSVRLSAAPLLASAHFVRSDLSSRQHRTNGPTMAGLYPTMSTLNPQAAAANTHAKNVFINHFQGLSLSAQLEISGWSRVARFAKDHLSQQVAPGPKEFFQTMSQIVHDRDISQCG